MTKRRIKPIYLLSAITLLGLLLYAAGAIQRAEIRWRLRQMDAAVTKIHTAPRGRPYSADEEPWIEFRRHRDRLVELSYLFYGEYELGSVDSHFHRHAPTGGGYWPSLLHPRSHVEQHPTKAMYWRVWDTPDMREYWDTAAANARSEKAERQRELEMVNQRLMQLYRKRTKAAGAGSPEAAAE